MRFHVPALPGRPVTRENSSCAYSGYVRKFCRMMRERGHEVVLYTGRESDAPVTELVACYPGSDPPPFDRPDLWADANQRAIDNIRARAEPDDFLCLIDGTDQEQLLELPLMAVEYRVGYGGVRAPFRIWETYAWMHVVYGATMGSHTADGRFFDEVIYPPFEAEDFPAGDGGDYLLYVGRLIQRKGVEIAVEVAKRTGRQLFLAGEGDYRPGEGEPGIEYIGHVGPDDRGELMAGALALFYPTLYVEPGGGAAIEAQMCGTPVISTDWGCFVETVPEGAGFRCRMLRDFVSAVDAAESLDRDWIRKRAQATYSLEVIGEQYERYFERLNTLRGEGFYAAPEERRAVQGEPALARTLD
jgi:glycosyltransferase involved in cell wall biosynthesis